METNDIENSSDHQLIEAPSGVDLHPQPRRDVRISRRASMAIVSVIVLLLIAFAFGGYRRSLTNQAAASDAGLPRNVTPATQAGAEFMRATPAGMPMTLRPPDRASSAQTMIASCGADRKTCESRRRTSASRKQSRRPPAFAIPPPPRSRHLHCNPRRMSFLRSKP